MLTAKMRALVASPSSGFIISKSVCCSIGPGELYTVGVQEALGVEECQSVQNKLKCFHIASWPYESCQDAVAKDPPPCPHSISLGVSCGLENTTDHTCTPER